MSFVPMDLIMASKYAEFPDAIWTLELPGEDGKQTRKGDARQTDRAR